MNVSREIGVQRRGESGGNSGQRTAVLMTLVWLLLWIAAIAYEAPDYMVVLMLVVSALHAFAYAQVRGWGTTPSIRRWFTTASALSTAAATMFVTFAVLDGYLYRCFDDCDPAKGKNFLGLFLLLFLGGFLLA